MATVTAHLAAAGAGASAPAPAGPAPTLARPEDADGAIGADGGQVFVIGTGPDRHRCVLGPFINAEFARMDAQAWAEQDPQMHLEVWVVACITAVPLTCGTCAVDAVDGAR